YIERRLVERNGQLEVTNTVTNAITEAVSGQGARTALAVAHDGRVAVYRGRLIQFFQNHQAAPNDSSIRANGSGGEVRQLLWDTDGNTLGAVFTATNNHLRLECWRTATNFPPEWRALSTNELECKQLVSANRGRQFLGRSIDRGVFRFDPESV